MTNQVGRACLLCTPEQWVVLAPQFDDDRFRELSPQRQIDGLRYVLVYPAIRFGTLFGSANG